MARHGARAIATLLTVGSAAACPACHTVIGEQVRAGTFNGSFWIRLLATIAPVPVLAAVVACIYFGLPSFKQAERSKDER